MTRIKRKGSSQAVQEKVKSQKVRIVSALGNLVPLSGFTAEETGPETLNPGSLTSS